MSLFEATGFGVLRKWARRGAREKTWGRVLGWLATKIS